MPIKDYSVKYYQDYIDYQEFLSIKDSVLSYVKKNIKNFIEPFNEDKFKSDFPSTRMSNLIPIYRVINNHFKKYVNSKFIDSNTLQISNIWVNVTRKGEFQNYHNHIVSGDPVRFTKYSGTIYIKRPKNSGNILFTNEDLYNSIEIEPEEGTIILFPSYLRHSVTPNLSKEERVSVSFNIEVDCTEYLFKQLV